MATSSKNEVLIIKRLEILKSMLELEDFESVQMQVDKLQAENVDGLSDIIKTCKNAVHQTEKIIKLIDDYIYQPRTIQLTQHQQTVYNQICQEFDAILSEQNQEKFPYKCFVSLSGFAGVGKTFVTSKLIEYFIKKQDYKILLTTPTHKSLHVAKYMIQTNNLQVPTRTLQAYLDLKLITDYYRGTKAFKRDKIDKQADYEKNLDILIVDESSMVSNELLGFIEENLAQAKLKSVLFIGDPYQLPPVDAGKNSVANLPKTFHLTEVVRQAHDSYIKKIAIELKECISSKEYMPISEIINTKKYPQLRIFYEERELYDDFSSYGEWDVKNHTVLSYTNDNVDRYNRILRNRYWAQQNIVPREAIIEGDIVVFNESYKKSFFNSESVKIMSVKKLQNHYVILKENDKEVYLNYFDCITDDGRKFNVVDPEHYKSYNTFLEELSQEARNKEDKEERRKLWRRFFAIKEEYADLKYKYASTIHKSQGSTYDIVYIDMSSIIKLSTHDMEMAFRLLYVAVTRASKELKILIA